jgi:hypothetical protein
MRRFVPSPRSSKALVALGATFVGVVASLTATIAPAGAASSTASLTMSRPSAYPSQGCWTAAGTIPMSRWDAEGFLDNGAYLVVDMLGDDPVFDNWLHGFHTYENAGGGVRFFASERGIEWFWSGCAPRTSLDEDWGEDEIYVHTQIVDGDGHYMANVKTNVFRTSW